MTTVLLESAEGKKENGRRISLMTKSPGKKVLPDVEIEPKTVRIQADAHHTSCGLKAVR